MKKIIPLLMAACFTLSIARAQNLLQNGNFNGSLTGTWSTWTYGGGWIGPTTNPLDLYDGTACVYMGGNDAAGAGLYQVVFGQPNVPYTVSCASAVNNWWWPAAEMRLFFLDASDVVLASSVTNCAASITAGDVGLPWSNYTMTATSPIGTVKVKVELACPAGHGTIRFDNAMLTAPLVYPTISNIYPDGSALMQAINALSFTAASTAATINASGIQVTVNGVDVSTNLIVTGSAQSKDVVYTGITSNKVYAVNIQVSDANGLIVSKALSFDTFNPNFYTVEAEDWDFNGGQFIDNPQTNAYFGSNSVADVDYHEISTGTNSATWTYRPWVDASIAVPQTEATFDVKRAQYAAALDYDVGWFDSGEWLNYTRTYPTGLYNVWARMASPGASTLRFSQVTAGRGTIDQTVVTIGNFAQTGGLGWSGYSWVPLTDALGNLVKLNLGGVTTLRATGGGNANYQFFMLVPADTNAPAITGMYPDGSTLFQATNKLSFNVGSVVGVNAGGISVTLNVTNVALHYGTTLTSTNGLVIGGTANNRTVAYSGLVPNANYSAVITVTDIGNNTTVVKPHFDTYTPALTWEAEDWDFNGGSFIDNPAVDAYGTLTGYEGIDFHDINGTGAHTYRPDAMAAGTAGDVPRTQYLSPATNDYAIGYFAVPEWVNYTRTFPAGTYNVYARLAAGGGNSVQSLSVITNDMDAGTHATNQLGTFSGSTAGWNAFAYIPLRDQFGNLVQLPLNGKTTLRVQRTGGADANDNFYMLVPADTTLPTINQVTPIGWMQRTNQMHFIAASANGIATSNIVVTINGVKASNLTFTGSANNWIVSSGLGPNVVYTAVITVTDNNGAVATTTVNFDTISSTAYLWEVEDYDYNSGQFIDNPQVNGYVGLSGTMDIDFHRAGTGGTALYRPDNVATEMCGDIIRPQYNNTGYNDVDVGNTATGDWRNYTRTFPTGKFNVYLRAARGTTGTGTPGLYQVTSGWGTTTQTTTKLGSFTVPNTGAWQTYTWVELKDASGEPVVVSLSGTNTLRLTDGGGNFNFLQLAPALVQDCTITGTNMNVSFGTESGFTYTVWYAEDLAGSWTELKSVEGDGSVKTVTDPATDPKGYYRLQVH
jgi:hypothetical protein